MMGDDPGTICFTVDSNGRIPRCCTTFATCSMGMACAGCFFVRTAELTSGRMSAGRGRSSAPPKALARLSPR
jgi:hypothetical protein